MAEVIQVQMVWNTAFIQYITYDMEVAAHAIAAPAAAKAAQGAINAKAPRTGQLEADVGEPKSVSPMVSDIGSSLPYAAIQNSGGTVHGRPLLYIQADMGNVYAVASSVPIPAKHYLDAAIPVYVSTCISAMQGLFP